MSRIFAAEPLRVYDALFDWLRLRSVEIEDADREALRLVADLRFGSDAVQDTAVNMGSVRTVVTRTKRRFRSYWPFEAGCDACIIRRGNLVAAETELVTDRLVPLAAGEYEIAALLRAAIAKAPEGANVALSVEFEVYPRSPAGIDPVSTGLLEETVFQALEQALHEARDAGSGSGRAVGPWDPGTRGDSVPADHTGGIVRMRLSKPRLEPLPEEAWNDEVREVLSGALGANGRPLNIFATLARHPKLLKRWLVFGNHVLAKQTLSPRDRELAILRIGWLCRAEYEWAQHAVIARHSDIGEDEIARVTEGPEAAGWSKEDAALLRAVDELHGDAFIGDATWAALSERYSNEQLIDLVFTVGQYNLVSMALNTLGVQLDPGLAGFPE